MTEEEFEMEYLMFVEWNKFMSEGAKQPPDDDFKEAARRYLKGQPIEGESMVEIKDPAAFFAKKTGDGNGGTVARKTSTQGR